VRWFRNYSITLPIPLVLVALAVGLAAIVVADRFAGILAGLAVAIGVCLVYDELRGYYARRHRERIRREPPRVDAAWYHCVTVVAAFLIGWFSPLPLWCAFYIWWVAEDEGSERLERGLARWDGWRAARLRDRPTP
jgi:hypothetical protein